MTARTENTEAEAVTARTEATEAEAEVARTEAIEEAMARTEEVVMLRT